MIRRPTVHKHKGFRASARTVPVCFPSRGGSMRKRQRFRNRTARQGARTVSNRPSRPRSISAYTQSGRTHERVATCRARNGPAAEDIRRKRSDPPEPGSSPPTRNLVRGHMFPKTELKRKIYGASGPNLRPYPTPLNPSFPHPYAVYYLPLSRITLPHLKRTPG